MIPDLTGIILAGGESRRMGTNKAFVEIEGLPMIRRVLAALRVCCSTVIIVAKDIQPYRRLGVRVVADAHPAQSALVGLCSGLAAATTPWAFVAACDLPFLSPEAVRMLARAAAGFEAAVPRVHGLWHPLHAVYATSAQPALEAQMTAGVLRLADAIQVLRLRPVTVQELESADATLRTLRNVNSAREQRLLAAGAASRPGGEEATER